MQVPCQTQATWLGLLFCPLSLQPRLISSGFRNYEMEVLWSGQKSTAPRDFKRNLSVHPKFCKFFSKGFFVVKPAIFHVWMYAKLIRIDQRDGLILD